MVQGCPPAGKIHAPLATCNVGMAQDGPSWPKMAQDAGLHELDFVDFMNGHHGRQCASQCACGSNDNHSSEATVVVASAMVVVDIGCNCSSGGRKQQCREKAS